MSPQIRGCFQQPGVSPREHFSQGEAKQPPAQSPDSFRGHRKYQAHPSECVEIWVVKGGSKDKLAGILAKRLFLANQVGW